MRMGLRGIWVIIIVLAFFVGTITTGIVVFADEAPKTLAEECAEELEDDDMDLDGMFCLAIQSLNAQFDGIFVQTDRNKPVLYLQVDPNSQAPALVVNDGTHDLFIVNNDGSIQIGSNTVVLNPDGTVTGGPLHMLAGSTVDNELISTEPDQDTLGALACSQKQLAQVKGNSWKCSNPEDIGGVASNVVVLHYERSSPVTVPSTTLLPDLIELAVWKIVKNPAFVYDEASTILYDSSVFADINGDIDIGWYKSKDGTIWKTIDDISASTGTFKVRSEFGFQTSISSQIDFIAFGTANSFGSSAGVVKDFSGTITIHLPPGQSLMRIL